MQRSQGISQCCTRLRKPVLPGTIPRFESKIFRNQVGCQANKIEFCPCTCLPLPHALYECDDQLAGKWLLGALAVKRLQFSKELDSRGPGRILEQIGNRGDERIWMAQVQETDNVRPPVSTTQDRCDRRLQFIAR